MLFYALVALGVSVLAASGVLEYRFLVAGHDPANGPAAYQVVQWLGVCILTMAGISLFL